MSSTYRYQIPVEQTQWKFEGQSETILTWEYEDGRGKLLIYGLLAPGALRSRAGSAPG